MSKLQIKTTTKKLQKKLQQKKYMFFDLQRNLIWICNKNPNPELN